MDKFMILRQQ